MVLDREKIRAAVHAYIADENLVTNSGIATHAGSIVEHLCRVQLIPSDDRVKRQIRDVILGEYLKAEFRMKVGR